MYTSICIKREIKELDYLQTDLMDKSFNLSPKEFSKTKVFAEEKSVIILIFLYFVFLSY